MYIVLYIVGTCIFYIVGIKLKNNLSRMDSFRSQSGTIEKLYKTMP